MAEGYADFAEAQGRCVEHVRKQYLEPFLLSALDEQGNCDSSSVRLRTSTSLKRTNKEEAVFHFADYGAADCGNSRDVLRLLAEAQRRLHVSVVDLPGNDWTAAGRNVRAALRLRDGQDEQDPEYDAQFQQSDHEDVGDPAAARRSSYSFVRGSFYDQLLEQRSVDAGLCVIATHWLSAETMAELARSSSPGPFLPDAVLAQTERTTGEEELSDAGSSSHADDLARVRELAAQDAERFLAARGRELKPGGRLFLANSAWTYIAVCDDVGEILRTLPDKSSSHTALERLSFPMYYRKEEEWGDAVSSERVRATGLRLLRQETCWPENPYYERVFGSARWSQREGGGCPASEFADLYLKSILAWGSRLLADAFECEERVVIDAFWERVAAKEQAGGSKEVDSGPEGGPATGAEGSSLTDNEEALVRLLFELRRRFRERPERYRFDYKVIFMELEREAAGETSVSSK